jgi:hypothetical protein
LSMIIFIFGITYSFYIFMTSDQPDVMLKYFWIPTLLAVALSSATLLTAGTLAYLWYTHKKKAQITFLEDKKRKRDLLYIEDKLLTMLESKIISMVETGDKDGKFTAEAVTVDLKNIAAILKDLTVDRKEKIEPIPISSELKDKITSLVKDNSFMKTASEFPEFAATFNSLKDFGSTKKKITEKCEEEIKSIEEFLLRIVNIATDRHLMMIIESSEELTALFSRLAEIFTDLQSSLDKKMQKEEIVGKKESLYLKAVESLTKSRGMDKITMNPDYAMIYNDAVDLYNHYKRREEIKNEINQMEKQMIMENSSQSAHSGHRV